MAAEASATAITPSKWESVLPPFWKDIIAAYLKDDAPSFDVGGFVVGGAHFCGIAHILHF